jgi:hypothetical protein
MLFSRRNLNREYGSLLSVQKDIKKNALFGAFFFYFRNREKMADSIVSELCRACHGAFRGVFEFAV